MSWNITSLAFTNAGATGLADRTRNGNAYRTPFSKANAFGLASTAASPLTGGPPGNANRVTVPVQIGKLNLVVPIGTFA